MEGETDSSITSVVVDGAEPMIAAAWMMLSILPQQHHIYYYYLLILTSIVQIVVMLSEYGVTAPRKLRSAGKRSLNGGRRAGAGIKRKKRDTTAATEGRKKQRIQQRIQDELEQNHDEQIDQLSNPQGRSLSGDVNEILLRIMMTIIRDEDITQTKMLKRVENLSGISYKVLHRLYRHWADNSEVLVIDSSNRGGGSPKHIHHDTDLNMEQICSIHEFIQIQPNEGKSITARNIIDHMRDTFNITIASRTMQSLLNRLGYKYGKAKYIGAMNDVARRKRIRTFLHQYSKALNEENTLIIYTDESYVNANHSSAYTWLLLPRLNLIM